MTITHPAPEASHSTGATRPVAGGRRGARRLGPLPAGVFSNSAAMLLMAGALALGWLPAAGAIVALPVLLDRRPADWAQFATAGGLLTVCATVAQATQRGDTALVFLMAAVLCGLAAAMLGRKD